MRDDGLYNTGDVIAEAFEIETLIGQGGFASVYAARDEFGRLCALKSFREEFFAEPRYRLAFRKEAHTWLTLGNHPHVLEMKIAAEDPATGLFFIVMEFIAPDKRGRTTLTDYLDPNNVLAFDSIAAYGIQFCLGMEHAIAHGLAVHGDIKPDNILVSNNGLKISDFGIASIALSQVRGQECVNRHADGRFLLSRIELDNRTISGTPGYMAPEVLLTHRSNHKSDVYQFGLVLWQLTTGCPHSPFSALFNGDMSDYLQRIVALQQRNYVPHTESPLLTLIERCLRYNPDERPSFHDLRRQIEDLTGVSSDAVAGQDRQLTGLEQLSKGISFLALGRPLEALRWLDAAGRDEETAVLTLVHKAYALLDLERFDEAIWCARKARNFDDKNVSAILAHAAVMRRLGEFEEAISLYDNALRLEPNAPLVHFNKGIAERHRGHIAEALACYERGLDQDPSHVACWQNKAVCLQLSGQGTQALSALDRVLMINPLAKRALAMKGDIQLAASDVDQALTSYESAIAADAAYAPAWVGAGEALLAIGRTQEALDALSTAIELDANDANAWYAKASVFTKLRDTESERICIRKFLETAPPSMAVKIDKATKRWSKLRGRC